MDNLKRLDAYIDRTDIAAKTDQIKVLKGPPSTDDFNSAVIPQLIPQLEMKWDVASNIVIKKEIVQREYKELIFPEDKPTYIDQIDLGYYDDELEGQYFFLVTSFFYEYSYSSNGLVGNNFYEWLKSCTEFRLDKYFHDEITETIIWERPKIPVRSDNQSSNNQSSNNQSSNNQTGNNQSNNFSSNLSSNQTSNSNDNESTGDEIWVYETETEIELEIELNKALGVVFTSDGVFDVIYEGEIYQSNVTKSQKIAPLLSNSITIKFSTPTQELPTYLQIDLYGTKGPLAGIEFSPLGERKRSKLYHKKETKLKDRLLPPNKPEFSKYKFWNELSDETRPQIKDFMNRKLKTTKVIKK